MRDDLLGLDPDAFAAWGRALVGHDRRFHRELHRRLLASGRWEPCSASAWSADHGANPDILGRLAAAAAVEQAPAVVDARSAEDAGWGTTTKLQLRLADGAQVEAVSIPMGLAGADLGRAAQAPPRHRTLCVSTQVGCRMGCTFCHTAKMGLVRQLGAHEIVGQVVAASAHLGGAPRNVVFMGMGEPLDNAEAVAAAVRVLTHPEALGLAQRHVTLSTVGRTDQLRRLPELGLAGINLAVSLTAVDEDLRRELMPVTRLHPLAELRQALLDLRLPRDRRILFGCVVIPGVTDAPAHLAALARWLHGLPALVNLIPYNPIPGRAWRAPTLAEVEAARAALDRLGVPVRVRLTKGEAVMAACGQLGTGRRGRPAPSA